MRGCARRADNPSPAPHETRCESRPNRCGLNQRLGHRSCFAASARNQQPISRASVVSAGLAVSNSMVLLDESWSVGLAARSLLEILQQINSEVSAPDRCRPTVQRARLRYLRLRAGHPLPPRQSGPLFVAGTCYHTQLWRFQRRSYGNASAASASQYSSDDTFAPGTAVRALSGCRRLATPLRTLSAIDGAGTDAP